MLNQETAKNATSKESSKTNSTENLKDRVKLPVTKVWDMIPQRTSKNRNKTDLYMYLYTEELTLSMPKRSNSDKNAAFCRGDAIINCFINWHKEIKTIGLGTVIKLKLYKWYGFNIVRGTSRLF